MKENGLRKDVMSSFYYFLAVILLGLLVEIFHLNAIECSLVLEVQDILAHVLPVQIFVIFSYLGDLRFLLIISLSYFVYSYYKSKSMDREIGLLVFLAIVTISTYFLKELFSRERPYMYSANIISYADENDFSFPSGHVSRSFGAYSIILDSTNIGRTLLLVMVTLISLSRIVLGAHYVTDVVGAIFLSLFSGKLTNITLYVLNSRFKIVPEKM
ncbi:MAG: phosphatase PAP2 family protein [Nitrososphaeria archaeon]